MNKSVLLGLVKVSKQMQTSMLKALIVQLCVAKLLMVTNSLIDRLGSTLAIIPAIQKVMLVMLVSL
jgi:hypothetical protein